MLCKKQAKWKVIILLTAVVNVLIFMGIAVSPAYALEPGDLDPTFGDGGMVAIDFLASQADYARDAVAVQPDGKIVVVGESSTADTGKDFAIARYNPDGSLDASFGDGGRVTSSRGSGVGNATYESATGVAIDSGGKIVVAGNSSGGGDFVVARYSPDGSLDTGFGNNGWVITDIGSNDYAHSVAVDEYDRIVVAGYSHIQRDGNWQFDFFLVRYNIDGNLDTNFGMDLDGDGTRDGKVITDFGLTDERAQSVVIDGQDRIVVVGWSRQPIEGWPENYTANDFAIVRYNTDGSLDTSFGGDGMVTTDFGLGLWANYYAYDVAVDSADRIIAVGYGQNVSGWDFLLARYNDDGSLDATFDGDGMVTTNFIGLSCRALSVAVDWEDRIVVAGYNQVKIDGVWQTDFALARYHSDGSLDTAFGGEGKVITDFDARADLAYGVAIDGANKIVAAGTSFPPNAMVDETVDFALARYNIDGSLDTSFGGDGKVTTDFIASNSDVAQDVVACQSDGKIVVVGWSTASGMGNVFALARLNTDGSLDATFGTDGKVVMPLGGAKSVAVDEYDRIVVAGYGSPGGFGFLLARYNSDGTLDTSFGDGGIVTTNFGSNGSKSQDVVETLAIGSDGKIVVAGWSVQPWPSPTGRDFAVARYNPDGSLDTTLGGDGTITTDFGFIREEIRSVAVQADGKIVAAGSVSWPNWPNYEFAVVRYNVDGSLDTTFGDGGIVIEDFGENQPSLANGVAIDTDGKIVVAGYHSYNRLALARYNTDGSLDPTFDGDGMVTGISLAPLDVVIDAQGRIVVAGAPWPGFKVGRFNSDGSPDLSFGTNGIASSNFGGFWELARGVDIDRDGNIVVAGHSWLPGTGRGYDFIVARFIGQSNQPPVADAGTDQSVHPGDEVTLDGSLSTDPDENYPLTYSWQITSIPDDSTTVLGNFETVRPTFIPDMMGDYIIELVVTDSLGAQSAADSVLVSTCNTPPVADAGPDQAIIELGTIVQLGTDQTRQSWDADGDDFTYLWTMSGKPAGSAATLDDPTFATPTFVADVQGDYVISLVVTDIFNAVSDADTVAMSFTNVKPVADAGGSQAVIVGETVFLDGSASHDENGDPLTYSWSFVSVPEGSLAELSDPTSVQSSFVADEVGTFIVSLVVNDGFVDSNPANVTIEVISCLDAGIQSLLDLIEVINDLPQESLKNRNMKTPLINKVNAVLNKIERGLYDEALDKLQNDILGKTNGCAETGEPDKNDWLVTCAAQDQVYPLILSAIAFLENPDGTCF